jgi:phage terminase large subunit-like protein
VEIRLVSSDPLIRTISIQKSDKMEVTLFADARNLDQNQPANHYPFDEELMLEVHSVEVDYKKTGSTRTAVICNYDLSESEGLIMFANDPQE